MNYVVEVSIKVKHSSLAGKHLKLPESLVHRFNPNSAIVTTSGGTPNTTGSGTGSVVLRDKL